MSVFPPDTRSIFQLTPSRRATNADIITHLLFLFQLTPSRRATVNLFQVHFLLHISTHALTEGDWICVPYMEPFFISTHALTEGDDIGLLLGRVVPHFNSRPHGGRRRCCDCISRYFAFQLTPSRRATRTVMFSIS